MKKAFVTGWPINHSKSPMLHGFWLKQYGIEGSYEALGVEPENFEQFLKELPTGEFVGGNVTIPHKEVAFANVDQLDDAAAAIGAVNTLWLEGEKLCGSNTDAYGFSANMDQFAPEWRDGKRAIVMGAGGASRAIIYAILEAGFEEVHIVNPHRSSSLILHTCLLLKHSRTQNFPFEDPKPLTDSQHNGRLSSMRKFAIKLKVSFIQILPIPVVYKQFSNAPPRSDDALGVRGTQRRDHKRYT